MVNKVLFFLSFFSAVVITKIGTADTLQKYRVSCDGQQRIVVLNGLSEAKRLLTETMLTLPPKNSSEGAIFERWFGLDQGASSQKIHDALNEYLSLIDFSFYWCPNISFPSDDVGTFAFVSNDSKNEIYFMTKFFESSATGIDSQAGTIIHEVSHLGIIVSTIDAVRYNGTIQSPPSLCYGGNTKHLCEFLYGPENAQIIAKENPSIAQRSADNFQYFIENTVYGTP